MSNNLTTIFRSTWMWSAPTFPPSLHHSSKKSNFVVSRKKHVTNCLIRTANLLIKGFIPGHCFLGKIYLKLCFKVSTAGLTTCRTIFFTCILYLPILELGVLEAELHESRNHSPASSHWDRCAVGFSFLYVLDSRDIQRCHGQVCSHYTWAAGELQCSPEHVRGAVGGFEFVEMHVGLGRWE